MGTLLSKMDDTEEVSSTKQREPLTKEEVQQIAKQLTENSISELCVASYDSCMYDGGGGVICFKVIFNCCYLL